MSIFKCDVPGCKKSTLRRHTHVTGDLIGFADRGTIEDYRWYAQMRGEPVQIPGGSASDMSHYMTRQVKAWDKEAKEFRKKLPDLVKAELEAQKRRGEKQDKGRAEKTVRAKFGWKK